MYTIALRSAQRDSWLRILRGMAVPRRILHRGSHRLLRVLLLRMMAAGQATFKARREDPGGQSSAMLWGIGLPRTILSCLSHDCLCSSLSNLGAIRYHSSRQGGAVGSTAREWRVAGEVRGSMASLVRASNIEHSFCRSAPKPVSIINEIGKGAGNPALVAPLPSSPRAGSPPRMTS